MRLPEVPKFPRRFSEEDIKNAADLAAQRRQARGAYVKGTIAHGITKDLVRYASVLLLGVGLGIFQSHGTRAAVTALGVALLIGILLGAFGAFLYLLRTVQRSPQSLFNSFLAGMDVAQTQHEQEQEVKTSAPICVMCLRTFGMPDSRTGECPMCLAEVLPDHPLWPHLELAEKETSKSELAEPLSESAE